MYTAISNWLFFSLPKIKLTVFYIHTRPLKRIRLVRRICFQSAGLVKQSRLLLDTNFSIYTYNPIYGIYIYIYREKLIVRFMLDGNL